MTPVFMVILFFPAVVDVEESDVITTSTLGKALEGIISMNLLCLGSSCDVDSE